MTGGDDDEDYQTLLEANRRLEYMQSATSAITYAARADTFELTLMSANVKDVLGHDASSFIGSRTFGTEHIHPDDLGTLAESQAQLLESGTITFRVRYRHAQGHYLWMQGAARLVRDARGLPEEIVGYWIDVTDRIRAEHALARSEANFRALIERSTTAVFVHRDGKLVYVNPVLAAMLGYDSPSELIGRAAISLVAPADRGEVTQAIARTRGTGSSALKQARLLRRDGTTIVVESDGALLEIDGLPSSVVFARDTTERTEMFARIAVADRMVSVGTLAAGVAHEINNPLTYTMSNLAILARELPALLPGAPVDVAQLLREAQDGAERVSAIVRELRSLSRVDDETLGPVDVVAVLGTSLRIVQNEIRHRACVVRDLDEALPRVHANAARLGQVFLNLLLNAAQAIPEGRSDANEIRLRGRPSADGTKVVIDIEDTGTGMTPGVITRIFDPFFTTKPIGIGTGLGLAICHQIVRSLGGDIEVTSELDRGSVFRVILPASAAPPSLAPDVDSDRPAKTRRAVLFVDDEPLLGRSTALLLAPHHDVVAVTSGREAIRRIVSGESFDVILCDLMMPVMTGIELHAELERIAPAVLPRIVFMTGGAFTEEAQAFLAVPGRRHLEKPFSLRAIRALIETES